VSQRRARACLVGMARISLEPRPTGGYRLVRLVLRRRYGVMLDPITAAAHQPRVMGTRRDSDLYTPLERRVLAYAEAMTATPPEVTDEMVAP
jgi:hypothetical protein